MLGILGVKRNSVYITITVTILDRNNLLSSLRRKGLPSHTSFDIGFKYSSFPYCWDRYLNRKFLRKFREGHTGRQVDDGGDRDSRHKTHPEHRIVDKHVLCSSRPLKPGKVSYVTRPQRDKNPRDPSPSSTLLFNLFPSPTGLVLTLYTGMYY